MSTQQADKGEGDIIKSTITINETAQAISSNIICQDTDRGQRRFFYFPAIEERYPLGEIQAAATASTARGPEIPGEDFADLPIRFRHNLADLIDSLDVERFRSTVSAVAASSSPSSESPGFGSLIYTPSGGSAMKKRKIKKKMQKIKSTTSVGWATPRGRGGRHPSLSFRNLQFSTRKQKTDNSEIIELVDDDEEEDVVLLSDDGELEPGEIVSPAPVAQPSTGVRKSVDSEEVEIIGVTVAAAAPTPGPPRSTPRSTKRRKSSVAYLAKKNYRRLDASYNQSPLQRSAIQSHAIRRVKRKQQKHRYFVHPQVAACKPYTAPSLQRQRLAFLTRGRWSPRTNAPNRRARPWRPTVQVFPPEAPNFINAASDSASSKAPGSLRPIVIDGSNVAMSQTGDRCFFCRRIRICVDFFKKRGHEVIVIVPQWRLKPRESIDTHILEELQKEKLIGFTPSREVGGRRIASYDDVFIVQYADMVDGIIVSNDQFKDIYEQNVAWRSTIANRILQHTFLTDDCLMFPLDPLGRNGPSLEQFLRF